MKTKETISERIKRLINSAFAAGRDYEREAIKRDEKPNQNSVNTYIENWIKIYAGLTQEDEEYAAQSQSEVIDKEWFYARLLTKLNIILSGAGMTLEQYRDEVLEKVETLQAKRHQSQPQTITKEQPDKAEQKKLLIEMMQGDEELGLYEDRLKCEKCGRGKCCFSGMCKKCEMFKEVELQQPEQQGQIEGGEFKVKNTKEYITIMNKDYGLNVYGNHGKAIDRNVLEIICNKLNS